MVKCAYVNKAAAPALSSIWLFDITIFHFASRWWSQSFPVGTLKNRREKTREKIWDTSVSSRSSRGIITFFCWKEILLCSLLILRIKLKHHLKKVIWYWTNNARFTVGHSLEKYYCLFPLKGCFKFQVMFHKHKIQSLWKLQLIIIIPPLRHFIILGQKNAQNMPRYYTVEQGKNTDWRCMSNKMAA